VLLTKWQHPIIQQIRRGDRRLLYIQFGDPMLAPRRLLDRQREDRGFETRGEAIAQIRLPTADLAQRLFTASRTALKTDRSYRGCSPSPCALRHMSKLLGELQHAHFRFDDLVLSRHALSVSDGQITS
jgi:hypothetical protein